MRISDWSSDVCSSDLVLQPRTQCGIRFRRAEIVFRQDRGNHEAFILPGAEVVGLLVFVPSGEPAIARRRVREIRSDDRRQVGVGERVVPETENGLQVVAGDSAEECQIGSSEWWA